MEITTKSLSVIDFALTVRINACEKNIQECFNLGFSEEHENVKYWNNEIEQAKEAQKEIWKEFGIDW